MKRLFFGAMLWLSTSPLCAAEALNLQVTIERTPLFCPAPGATAPAMVVMLEPGCVLKVEKQQGDYLWVDAGQRGWVHCACARALDTARAIFNAQLARDNYATRVYVYRGFVSLALKDKQSAINDFSRAIELEAPNRLQALCGLAKADALLPVTAQGDGTSECQEIASPHSEHGAGGQCSELVQPGREQPNADKSLMPPASQEQRQTTGHARQF